MEPVSHTFMLNMGWIYNRAGEYYVFNWNDEAQFQMPDEMVWESTMQDLRTCMYQMIAKHCYETGYRDGQEDDYQLGPDVKKVTLTDDMLKEYFQDMRDDERTPWVNVPDDIADFINNIGRSSAMNDDAKLSVKDAEMITLPVNPMDYRYDDVITLSESDDKWIVVNISTVDNTITLEKVK